MTNESDTQHLDSRYTWAKEATNGYRAGLGLYNFEITVEIYRDLKITGAPHPRREPEETPPFLMATNWCPGPMELIGPTGEKIPILKPGVISMSAYPEVLSYWTIQSDQMRAGGGAANGPTWGECLIFSRLAADKDQSNQDKGQLFCFQLKDYFNYDDPGTYQLTVWPKLYERSNTNDDIFHRIDLPPASISFTIGPKSK